MWTNKLLVDGSIQVVNLTPPKIGSIEVSANKVIINGSGGSPGASFAVLTTTNIAFPLTSWVPLVTNQFDWLGNFVLITAFNPAISNRFYALQLQ
jgi:hypothetical protein